MINEIFVKQLRLIYIIVRGCVCVCDRQWIITSIFQLFHRQGSIRLTIIVRLGSHEPTHLGLRIGHPNSLSIYQVHDMNHSRLVVMVMKGRMIIKFCINKYQQIICKTIKVKLIEVTIVQPFFQPIHTPNRLSQINLIIRLQYCIKAKNNNLKLEINY